MLNFSQKSTDIQGSESKLAYRIMGNVEKIPISLIQANYYQSLKFFEQVRIKSSAKTEILVNNIYNKPVILHRSDEGYEIVFGVRKFWAAKYAGLSEIPAIVLDTTLNYESLLIVLENIQTEKSDPLERAFAFKKIIENYKLTHEQLGKALGKSRTYVTNLLRVLQLPLDVQELIREGKVSVGHAKILAGLKDQTVIRSLTKKIVNEKLSVYETERLMELEKKLQYGGACQNYTEDFVHVQAVEMKLQERFGAKVKIKRKRKKYMLQFEFYDVEDFNRLIDLFLPSGL